jgi:hypothetical protein
MASADLMALATGVAIDVRAAHALAANHNR